VSVNGKEDVLPLEEAVVRLQEAEEERAEADRELSQILQKLGLWR
jgi:type I restriction enzyme M protein